MLGLRCCSSYFICIEREYSWLQCAGFSLWGLLVAGAGPRLKGCSGCGRRAQRLLLLAQQYLWCTGLVAPPHVGSPWTRVWTCVPCIDRWILLHCAPREVHICVFFSIFEHTAKCGANKTNRRAATKPPVTFWHFIIFASCPQSLFLRNKTSRILVKTVVPPIEEQLVHILHKDMHPPWLNSFFH